MPDDSIYVTVTKTWLYLSRIENEIGGIKIHHDNVLIASGETTQHHRF
jgi:hypothetical protein